VGSVSQRKIFRAYLASHFIRLEFERDFLPLGQARQTCPLDRADMHENIIPAILGLDETEPLLAIKPLDGTYRHLLSPKNTSREKHAIPIQLVDVFGKGLAGAFKKAQRQIEYT
jgi:hypothetical protein